MPLPLLFTIIRPYTMPKVPPIRAWLWAAVWSTLFTALFLAVLDSERCFFVVNSPSYIWTNTGLAWLWLYLFFLLSNRGRLVLVGCSALIFLVLGQVDRFPIAAAEARAVGELRSLTGAVEQFRKQHPQQGYPDALPRMPSKDVSKQYRIEYKTSRSKANGPTDGFLIEVTPTWRQCGFARSFTAAEGGQIYMAFQDRATTKADPTIE